MTSALAHGDMYLPRRPCIVQLTIRQALILSCKTELEHWQDVSPREQPDPGIAWRRQVSCRFAG